VPGVDGQLAGDESRLAAVTVLEDLEQVAALAGGERGEAPVVQDQQIDAGDGLEQAGVSPVAAGEGELLEEPRDAVVEDAPTVAAGLVAQRTGDPALAEPGRTSVMMPGVR
jgi:hypothetical protein